jgi:ATP-binding cassette, subfamily C (CFTR/MRP), member 1
MGFGSIWIGPLQIIIGIGLLINNLGYSALVGLGVLVLGLPIQFKLVRTIFTARKSGVQITDTRVRLTNEVLSPSPSTS